MIGRIFSLLLGLALVGLAVLLRQPELYGGYAPQVTLGEFEPYRVGIAGTAAMLGVMVLIAAILRKGEARDEAPAARVSEPAPDAEPFHSDPSSFRLGSTPTAQPLW